MIVDQKSEQPPDGGEDYKTPFERAEVQYAEAAKLINSVGVAAGRDVRALFALSQAQFEMLAAIHEALERIERNTRRSAADDAVSLLLPGIVDKMSKPAQ